MSFSSEQLNYLVYRYLKESGFQHSSFCFGHESSVAKAELSHDIPFGALITLVQKGLLYEEVESQLHKDGGLDEAPPASSLPRSTKISKSSSSKKKELASSGSNSVQNSWVTGTIIDEKSIEVKKENVFLLEGHTSEVFMCAWNPKQPLLASGSADCTARIWSINSGPVNRKDNVAAAKTPFVLKHSPNNTKDKTKEVTTLDWNIHGTMLATGSYDGLARVWDTKGNLKFKLSKHTQPIFSLKWNKSGDWLLSGGVDKTTIVWDANTGTMKQQFDFHEDPVLDVDWKTNTIFASCSTDAQIFVCEVGKTKPLARFTGHSADVNAVRWSPQGLLLASGSDDMTAKIWKMEEKEPVYNLAEHKKEIYTLKWSPTGPGTRNPNKNLYLATASFDATVKLWDAEAGRCVHTLAKHTDSVYSVAFSPDGDFVASGSFDKCLHIWSVKDGSLVKTYKGSGGIFEVCWNSSAEKVAACFADNTVAIIDFRI